MKKIHHRDTEEQERAQRKSNAHRSFSVFSLFNSVPLWFAFPGDVVIP